MASAVKKAIIYTLIAAAAVGGWLVSSNNYIAWLEYGTLCLSLFAIPVAAGSWYLVVSDRAREKKGFAKRNRNAVMAVFTVIAFAMVSLYWFGAYRDWTAGIGWIFFVLPTYCIELGIFLLAYAVKHLTADSGTEKVNNSELLLK